MSENNNKKVNTKPQKSNFFNLDSESDASEEDVEEEAKKKEDLEKKIKKWDWDRSENFELYYKHSQRPESSRKPKRSSLLVDYDENEDLDAQMSRKKSNSSLGGATRPFVESLNNDLLSQQNNLEFNLIGHKSCVNRIHWSKKLERKSILLSSSMDWLVNIIRIFLA